MRGWSPLHVAIRPTRLALGGLVAAGVAGLTVLVIGLSSASATTETTVSVPANKEFTDTGIALSEGDIVTIEASGKVKYETGGSSTEVSPVGVKFPQKRCGENSYPPNPAMAAPGVNCYSMIFKIGASGVAFPTGKKIKFESPVSGELFLGMNDNVYFDNSGSWTVKIKSP
jgi:hypothetical protein